MILLLAALIAPYSAISSAVEISEPQVFFHAYGTTNLTCHVTAEDNGIAKECTWTDPEDGTRSGTLLGKTCGLKLKKILPEDRGSWTCNIILSNGSLVTNTTQIYFVQESRPIISKISHQHNNNHEIRIDKNKAITEQLKCSLSNPGPWTKFIWYRNDEFVQEEIVPSLSNNNAEYIDNTLPNIQVTQSS